jgi:hypothetical protein
MLVTGWAVVLLQSLFLFSAVSALLLLFVSSVPSVNNVLSSL